MQNQHIFDVGAEAAATSTISSTPQQSKSIPTNTSNNDNNNEEFDTYNNNNNTQSTPSTTASLTASDSEIDSTTEFQSQFVSIKNYYTRSKKRSTKFGLRNSKIRSIYWKLFLGLFSQDSIQDWNKQINELRNQYLQYKDKYQLLSGSESTNDLRVNNPLSTSNNNPWQLYFTNSALSQTIQLDLTRTYPNNDWFQSAEIQSMLLNILLIWARLNPNYEYRQGFNELLAPIIKVVYWDAINHSNTNHSDNNSLLDLLLDKNSIEADSFALFQQIMIVMAPYFGENKPKPKPVNNNANNNNKTGSSLNKFNPNPDDIIIPDTTKPKDNTSNAINNQNATTSVSPEPQPESPIVKQSNYIHHTLLKQRDLELYNHLERCEVAPQLYLLRWYRLLFAREFHVDDCVNIWQVY
jgi:hypothetical protein